MNEQNWATQEAYNWLSNSEWTYNKIMSAPESERRAIIEDILSGWATQPEMYHQDTDWLAEVDLDSLAYDFHDMHEEAPRYEHNCNKCTFLGIHGEYDIYYHADGATDPFIFAKKESGSTLLMPVSDIKVLITGLSIAVKRGLAI